MARVSKMVVDRKRSVAEVRAALGVFKPKAAAEFGTAFDPILGDRPRPDILPIMEMAEELLVHTLDTLESSDSALQISASEDAGLTANQEDLVRRLGKKILRLRNLCLGHFDEETVVRVGLDEGISRQRDSLLHQVNLIHNHLTAPNLELPEAALAEPGPDPAALAAFFEPERTELADLVSTIRTERKRDALAVVEKQAMMDGHDQVFRRVVGFLKAVFRLAGEDELAERLVPAIRRLSRGAEDDGEEAEDDESQADEPSGPRTESPDAEHRSP